MAPTSTVYAWLPHRAIVMSSYPPGLGGDLLFDSVDPVPRPSCWSPSPSSSTRWETVPHHLSTYLKVQYLQALFSPPWSSTILGWILLERPPKRNSWCTVKFRANAALTLWVPPWTLMMIWSITTFHQTIWALLHYHLNNLFDSSLPSWTAQVPRAMHRVSNVVVSPFRTMRCLMCIQSSSVLTSPVTSTRTNVAPIKTKRAIHQSRTNRLWLSIGTNCGNINSLHWIPTLVVLHTSTTSHITNPHKFHPRSIWTLQACATTLSFSLIQISMYQRPDTFLQSPTQTQYKNIYFIFQETKKILQYKNEKKQESNISIEI